MIAYMLPIARLCLAIVFLYSGVDKLWHWRSSIEEVRSDGLPWPAAFAGRHHLYSARRRISRGHGLLCMVGRAVARRLYGRGHCDRASLLASPGAEFRHELTTSLEHLAIVGGLLLLSALDFNPAG